MNTRRPDLIDGLPYFATLNGQRLNRRQWLAATAELRKARLIADLRDTADTPDELD